MTGLVVENPCFPRSGHGVLRRALESYFGTGFRCVEVSGGTEPGDAWFLKNHDFGLRTRVHPSRRYLVQVRFPLASLASWFVYDEMAHGQGRTFSSSLRAGLLHRLFPGSVSAVYWGHYPKDRQTWMRVARIRLAFWIGFYRKWVLAPVPNRMVVDYDTLVGDPAGVLRKVIFWMTGQVPDPERISGICRRLDISRKSTLENFRHFEPGFFRFLGESLRGVPGVGVDERRLLLASVLGADELPGGAAHLPDSREGGPADFGRAEGRNGSGELKGAW